LRCLHPGTQDTHEETSVKINGIQAETIIVHILNKAEVRK